MSRRQALSLAAGVVLAPRLAAAETAADGFQVVRATAQQGKLLETGPETRLWGFGQKGVPAVLAARQGEEARFRFINDLDHEIWLHWFGVRGPSDLMTLNVPPGAAAAVDCVFIPPDAGTFWLGPMADQSRARAMGLYGLFVVAEKDPLPGVADLPVVITDWAVDDDGRLSGEFGDIRAAVAEGRLGNWFTLNGRYRPALKLAARAVTRLRLLNAANARVMKLQFKGDDPLLIALDGQPIAAPLALGPDGLTLAPGQRADLLTRATPGGTTLALDLFEETAEIGTLVPVAGSIPDLATGPVLPANPLPADIDPATAQRVDLVLEGGEKGGLTGAVLNGQQKDLRGLLEAGFGWAVNGVAGPGGPALGPFPKGLPVLLAVANRTAFDQPLHLHGHVWQVVEENGVVVSGGAWRDTSVIAARTTAKLLFMADNPGVWAIHSLIAERADSGLMVSFEVA